MNATSRFREQLERTEILPAMGGYDAFSASLIEQAGGEVVYMSGSSVSSSVHGYPDVGLTTMTEMVERARQMVNAVDVPVFCDADTGYGNPINVKRTVEEYESAGVAGIHIEDQTFPKKCGHFEDKGIVPTEEMVQKIRAAADSREDDDFALIARTDARAVEGFDSAVDRSRAYLEAGADCLFFEAPRDREELEQVGETFSDVPLIANMTEGGKTPLFTASEFEVMGFDVMLFPATGFKAAAKVLRDLYEEIAKSGTQKGMMDQLVTWEGRNDLTGLDDIIELERRYSTE
jgi:methylisocitrate lyase